MLNQDKSQALTDDQLYALLRATSLSPEIRLQAKKEAFRRNWSASQVQSLSESFQSRVGEEQKEPFNHPSCIIVFLGAPILLMLFGGHYTIFHLLIATTPLRKGNFTRYKQYWKLISLGLLFYLTVVLCICLLIK